MSAAPAIVQDPARLLIVDDEAVIVQLIQVVARRLAPEILLASCDNGARVQEAAEGFGPQLILLDLKMPGADGFEVIRRLRASELTRDIPVVVMTGLDTDETARKVGETASGLLRKPLEVEAIRQVLREHLLH